MARVLQRSSAFLWRRRGELIAVALNLIAVVVVIQAVRHRVYASLGYHMESRFGHLPPDDEPLTAWLAAQRGVVSHTVRVERVGDDLQTVRVKFIMAQNLAGEPAIPDLNTACEKLGYGSPTDRFNDVPR